MKTLGWGAARFFLLLQTSTRVIPPSTKTGASSGDGHSHHSTRESPGLKLSLKTPSKGAFGSTVPAGSSYPTTHQPALAWVLLADALCQGQHMAARGLSPATGRAGTAAISSSITAVGELSMFPFPLRFSLPMSPPVASPPPAKRQYGKTQAWAGRVNPSAFKHRWGQGRLSFFKSTIVVQFSSGTDSLALDGLSLLADYLWKKPFTLVNVKVSSNRPCHQSLWQKVREKLSSNGQHQTKQRLT